MLIEKSQDLLPGSRGGLLVVALPGVIEESMARSGIRYYPVVLTVLPQRRLQFGHSRIYPVVIAGIYAQDRRAQVGDFVQRRG